MLESTNDVLKNLFTFLTPMLILQTQINIDEWSADETLKNSKNE